MAEIEPGGRADWGGELSRLLVEDVQDGAIFLVDAEGLVRAWSREAECLLGYREGEILGRTAGLFSTLEDVRDDVFRRELVAARESGRGEADRWHVRKDGTRLWVSGVTTPLRDEAGKPRGFARVIRDRTQWWHADQCRREEEERSRTAFAPTGDASPSADRGPGPDRGRAAEAIVQGDAWLSTALVSIGDAVIAADGEGRVMFLNPVAEALTGWTQQEAAGRPMGEVFRIINEQTRQPSEQPVGRVIREGVNVGLANHTVLVARDGTETAIDDSAAPIRDVRGDVIGVVMVFRDVSKQRRHEAESRESRQFLASSLDALTAHIAVLDERGVILLVNDAWRRFSEGNGYLGADHGVGKNYFLACTDDEDAEHAEGGEGRCAARGIGDVMARRSPSFEMEYPCHGPDEQRWFLLRVTRFESGGEVRAVVAHENITRRKLAEDEVRGARDEAEHANKAKDQFLAVLSHELRTPLNPILLAASSMLEQPPGPGELRPTLEMIRQNVNLQARLIDDLLDVMRIVRGKMPLHWEVADCHDLIRLAMLVCRSEVQGKQVRLEMDLKAVHRHVNGDSARLEQVLWNLLKNAVKFTPVGGSITIRTRNEDDPAAGLDRLIIEVVDTGLGIEPGILPHIFDAFQQGETTINRKFGGLGLGLAICKGVVDAHGGTLTVESPGKDRGATFRVELKTMPDPDVEPESGPEAAAPAVPPSPSPLAILVVEDEPATLRLMARLLRGLGHDVTTASGVDEALEAERAGDFGLIISDIGLPDGSGLELMRRVVARRGPIPAIALTGYGMEDDIRRSRSAGFTMHMTKPIDFAKLGAMIRQVSS